MIQDKITDYSIDLGQDVIPAGLNEDTIKIISSKNNEPHWLLEYRLKAYKHWLKVKTKPPTWADLNIKAIDYNKISYYAGIKKVKYKSLEDFKKGWIKELK